MIALILCRRLRYLHQTNMPAATQRISTKLPAAIKMARTSPLIAIALLEPVFCGILICVSCGNEGAGGDGTGDTTGRTGGDVGGGDAGGGDATGGNAGGGDGGKRKFVETVRLDGSTSSVLASEAVMVASPTLDILIASPSKLPPDLSERYV